MNTQEAKKHMEKALDHFKQELSRLRTGRATTAMVEDVKVEIYGSQMSMKEVAALSIPDAKTIAIQPWDKGVIGDIEKAILASNLGFTPINDGKIIRINLPPLTEERRKDFVKQIKKLGEDTKVAIRNIRRDANDSLKKRKDASEISEDELKRFQDEVQKVTDQFVADTEKIIESKSKEVMTI